EQIERDLHAAFEELGSVKQSLKSLESSCEASRLRFEASQTCHELKRTAEEWLGLALARQALDRVRSKFERTCQPAVLASASRYLERLTRGRYRNIWTPLGRRELHIDDELVNFDQLRTEAAVDTLLEFAEQNQQVLVFTCHLHLAHMFEARGIAP